MKNWVVTKIDPMTGERDRERVYSEVDAVRLARQHQAAGFLGHIRPPIEDKRRKRGGR